MYRVGTGSVCQAGLQSAWGTPVAPDTLLNMTGETIKTTVEKGDEGNLLASKTRNQADVMSVKVDGGLSLILKPELIDWLLEASLGAKNDNVYTLAAPNTELPVSTFLLSRGGIVKTFPDVTIKSIKISAVGLQGNDLRLENLEIARAIVKYGKWDLMVLVDTTTTGVGPKSVIVSYCRGKNRGLVMKTVEDQEALVELSGLDIAQLNSE